MALQREPIRPQAIPTGCRLHLRQLGFRIVHHVHDCKT
jgi:hypothetical protein